MSWRLVRKQQFDFQRDLRKRKRANFSGSLERLVTAIAARFGLAEHFDAAIGNLVAVLMTDLRSYFA